MKTDSGTKKGARFVLRCDRAEVQPAWLGPVAIKIGRHPDNTLCLHDEKASRFHCAVEETGKEGRFRVTDLGSRNGTHVNGAPIDGPTKLRPGDTLRVGGHTFTLKMVRAAAGKEPPAAASVDRWMRNLEETLAQSRSTGSPRAEMLDRDGRASGFLDGDAVSVRTARCLFEIASATRATDLHVEPMSAEARVRMRVDGQMVTVEEIPLAVCGAVIGIVHGACGMPSAGRDAVLDGSFALSYGGERVDCRASLTPTVHGQKLVVRFLDGRHGPRSLSDLEMPGYMEERVRKACGKDAGLVLSCGPTGSGKTTTLHNALREINRETRNVVTIEDPVEQHLDGVTQLPVGRAGGFGELLRSVLRQDPDVILVGEIRDEETAVVAMRAAMTGHLVFSTVHARDTIGAVFRLLDLGVERYLVAQAVDVILAQRLLRTLCERCKRRVSISPSVATRLGRHLGKASHLYAPVGCPSCLQTGYQGRRGIFEMLTFNQDLRDLILDGPTIQKMREVIEQGVFYTLEQAGWRMAAKGETSLEEADRVAGPEQ